MAGWRLLGLLTFQAGPGSAATAGHAFRPKVCLILNAGWSKCVPGPPCERGLNIPPSPGRADAVKSFRPCDDDDMTEERPMIGINGMAHVILTVSQFEKGPRILFWPVAAVRHDQGPRRSGFLLPRWRPGRQLGSVNAILNSKVTASSSIALGCITCAFARGLVRTLEKRPLLSLTSGPQSFAARRSATGRRGTITFCSKTRTASAWKSISYLVQDC